MITSGVYKLVGVSPGRPLPANSLVGGYPLYYMDAENNTLCPKCANKEGYSSDIVHAEVYWEGEPLICADCNAEIESAYGDPNADESEDAESS